MSGPDLLAAAAATPRRARGTRERPSRQMIEFLRAVPLFAGVSRRHVRRIASLGRLVSFGPGRTLVERDVRGDSFYLILHGRAKVYRSVVPSGRAIARLEAGDYFGEMALLDGGPRTATVVSETGLSALKISRSAFRKLLLREPTVALRMLEALAARTRERESSANH